MVTAYLIGYVQPVTKQLFQYSICGEYPHEMSGAIDEPLQVLLHRSYGSDFDSAYRSMKDQMKVSLRLRKLVRGLTPRCPPLD